MTGDGHAVFLHLCLFSKQVAVGSGAGQCQHQNIILNTVYQKPIRQNMALSVSDPVPGQRVILAFLRECFSTGQNTDHVIQQLDIQMTLESQLVVLLELGRSDNVPVHRFSSRNASSTSE